MNRIKSWLCAHGVHWYIQDGYDIRCKWCGHVDNDNYDPYDGARPA